MVGVSYLKTQIPMTKSQQRLQFGVRDLGFGFGIWVLPFQQPARSLQAYTRPPPD